MTGKGREKGRAGAVDPRDRQSEAIEKPRVAPTMMQARRQASESGGFLVSRHERIRISHLGARPDPLD